MDYTGTLDDLRDRVVKAAEERAVGFTRCNHDQLKSDSERKVYRATSRDEELWGRPGATCGFWSAQKIDGQEVTVIPLMCGKWSCPRCGALRHRWFVGQVVEAAAKYRLEYFWTLTIAHGDYSAAASWRVVTAAWNRAKTRLEKEYGPIEYVWVIEPQKTGHAHLHILLDKRLEHEFVSRTWKWATRGSFVVWVKKVPAERAAWYMGKYMAKLWGRDLVLPGYGELKGRRKFGRSRGVVFKPFKQKASGWSVVPVAYLDYVDWLKNTGHKCLEREGTIPTIIVEKMPNYRPAWAWPRGRLGSLLLPDAYG